MIAVFMRIRARRNFSGGTAPDMTYPGNPPPRQLSKNYANAFNRIGFRGVHRGFKRMEQLLLAEPAETIQEIPTKKGVASEPRRRSQQVR